MNSGFRLHRRNLLIFNTFVVVLAARAICQTPQINSVQFSGSPGNYTLTVRGNNFGSPTVVLPFTGDVSNFRVGDGATLMESGYTGDADVLTYNSWSNTKVVVSGYNGQPGNAAIVALWNSLSGKGATWGGSVPTTTASPMITSVELSGSGKSLQIVVHGSGFGAAPSGLPTPGSAGDTNFFRFLDFRAHCGPGSSLFEAGFHGWGIAAPDSVTLLYESWSDDQIVVSGFGGSYGTGCAKYQAGDPIAVVVYSSTDAASTGPQTGWGGPAGAHVSISVKDVTTVKQISPGQTITAGDQFQVTVTAGPDYDCAGQFVVTALGAPGVPPSALVQDEIFILGPAVDASSVTGGILTSNGMPGHENDWKVSASCNGASPNSFVTATFEFLSAVP